MYPYTKFGIPTSNKIGDMLPAIGLDKQNFQCKIVNNSLPTGGRLEGSNLPIYHLLPTISLAYVWVLKRTISLSTHNICFG